MNIGDDILCLHCKGCGDVEINTIFSSDADGTVTKTTHLEGIWCDKRQDKVEPRFCCPCYDEDAPDYEDTEPETSTSLLFFQADEPTHRRIYETAQRNKMTEGQLIAKAVEYYLNEVCQP